MKIGYNTNGLGCHRWDDALRLLADVGYQSIAITLDHHWLDPFSSQLPTEIIQVKQKLEQLGLRSVIETGARFLLDPRSKHKPTLISPSKKGRAKRIEFLKRSIDIAATLGSDAVSFWSGILHEDISFDIALQRLIAGCREVTEYANTKKVQLAFEPEPGMFIETMEQYRLLKEHLTTNTFGLTIDIGHLQCVEEEPIATHLHRWKNDLCNIHIEDMKTGIHEHLRFGKGEIDFQNVFTALREINYRGPLNVELSRHSHMADIVVPESYNFLSSYLPS